MLDGSVLIQLSDLLYSYFYNLSSLVVSCPTIFENMKYLAYKVENTP